MTDELREIRDKIDRACRVGHMLAATLAVHLPPGHDMREEHTGRRLAQIEDEVDEVIRLRARERELMAGEEMIWPSVLNSHFFFPSGCKAYSLRSRQPK